MGLDISNTSPGTSSAQLPAKTQQTPQVSQPQDVLTTPASAVPTKAPPSFNSRLALKRSTWKQIRLPLAAAALGIAGSVALALFFPPALPATVLLALWGLYHIARCTVTRDPLPAAQPVNMPVTGAPNAAPAPEAPKPASSKPPVPKQATTPPVPPDAKPSEESLTPPPSVFAGARTPAEDEKCEAPHEGVPHQGAPEPRSIAPEHSSKSTVSSDSTESFSSARSTPSVPRESAPAPTPAALDRETQDRVNRYIAATRVSATAKTPSQFANELEASVLARHHDVVIRFWHPVEGQNGKFHSHYSTQGDGSEDGKPVIHLVQSDRHFTPLLNVNLLEGGEHASEKHCEGNFIDAGASGDCLFLSVGYFLQPDGNSPIRDVAQLTAELGVGDAMKAVHERSDLMAYFASAGVEVPTDADDFMRALRGILVRPYREIVADALQGMQEEVVASLAVNDL